MTDDIQSTTERTHMVYTESLETSACLSEISGALVALQLAQCSATPDKINPRFKSKYTSLESLQQAVLPTLAEHGVAPFSLLWVREWPRQPLPLSLRYPPHRTRFDRCRSSRSLSVSSAMVWISSRLSPSPSQSTKCT